LRLESLKARNQELDKLVERDQASVSEDRDRISEEIYGVKEKISQIEEKFLRTKNEYDTLMIELERVRGDIQITKQRDSSSVVGDFDTANLKDEEKLLLARIKRRRQLLEQAQLL
jgi:archaellum component FlaC